jgi:xanthine/CO dehydrogenase XdhC/CoxF family maturation factor
MPHAPRGAHHLILTYSHDIDLALCDAALRHGFATCGLIGSATKWARFRSRLEQVWATRMLKFRASTARSGTRASANTPRPLPSVWPHGY